MVSKARVHSIDFTEPPFRRLTNLKIKFSSRITLIAGHNGIGKTSILGFVSNTFGFASKELAKYKSYFGDVFSTNIEQILYISLDEIPKISEKIQQVPYVTGIVGKDAITKRCRLTKRGKYKRARVVSNTVLSQVDISEDYDFDPKLLAESASSAGKGIVDLFSFPEATKDEIEELDSDDDDHELMENGHPGKDAKIALPTIFLGLKRISSIGEASDSEIVSRAQIMDSDDLALYHDFINKVITNQGTNEKITQLGIKSYKKKSIQPGFDAHEALAISIGQDSLGGIATALASFNKLKREMGEDYPGGLLIVDELDVGFHPTAIHRLVKELKSIARRLQLQIIATTHSPQLIQAVYPDDNNKMDSVVYLVDPRKPRIAEDGSLQAILDDMSSIASPKNPVEKKKNLCVYFEDQQGVDFCSKIISVSEKGKMGRDNSVSITYIPLGIGGSNLLKLPSNDPIFLDRVLVVDADTYMPQKIKNQGNAVKFPCPKGASGTDRSPENIIINFLKSMICNVDGDSYKAMMDLAIKNPDASKIENTFFSTPVTSERDSTKKWWIANRENIFSWQVIEVWAKYHPRVVAQFKDDFAQAVANTAPRLFE